MNVNMVESSDGSFGNKSRSFTKSKAHAGVVNRVVEKLVAKMNLLPQEDLVSCLSLLSTLDFAPTDVQMFDMTGKIARDVSKMPPQSLPALLSSLHALNTFNSPEDPPGSNIRQARNRGLLQDILDRLKDSLSSDVMLTRDLSLLADTLAGIGHTVTPDWLELLHKAFTNRLNRASPADIGLIIKAFRKLDFTLEPEWIEACLAGMYKGFLSSVQCMGQELVTAATALECCNTVPSQEWQAAWLKVLLPMLNTVNADGLVSLAHLIANAEWRLTAKALLSPLMRSAANRMPLPPVPVEARAAAAAMATAASTLFPGRAGPEPFTAVSLARFLGELSKLREYPSANDMIPVLSASVPLPAARVTDRPVPDKVPQEATVTIDEEKKEEDKEDDAVKEEKKPKSEGLFADATPKILAQMLSALQVMSIRPPTAWSEAFVTRVDEVIDEFEKEDLMMVAKALDGFRVRGLSDAAWMGHLFQDQASLCAA